MPTDIIRNKTSRPLFVGEQHPAIKQVKKWHTTAPPDGIVLLDGIWGQTRALEAGIEIEVVILCPGLVVSKQAKELMEKLIEVAKECLLVSEKVFRKLSDRDEPDGFLSAVRLPKGDLSKISTQSNCVIVILDGPESPGNIGTILRSCDGAGADALFISSRRARTNHPKLVKGSMGAILTVPIVEFDSVPACKIWLIQNGFSIFLADTRSKTCYDEIAYTGKCAVVVGNERYGLSQEWYIGDAQLLSIPMNGRCDSLNAGVAASLLLYQICRQVK